MSLIQLQNVTYSYGKSKYQDHPSILDQLSLKVGPGERLAIVGASGAGKTTLVRIMAGLLQPHQGSVHLFNQDAASFTSKDWHKTRKRLQILFQNPSAMLHPDLPIQQILEESAALHQPEKDPTELAREVLHLVGLAHQGHARLHALSGGEQRRAGIGRIWLSRPDVIIADEPTTGLDAYRKAAIVKLLVNWAKDDHGLVLISHDFPMACWAATQIAVLHEGRIVDTLKSADIRQGTAQPTHPFSVRLLKAAGYQTIANSHP